MTQKPFALYYQCESSVQMIYVGADKSEAFDALMDFGRKSYFDSSSLKISLNPAPEKPKVTKLVDVVPELSESSTHPCGAGKYNKPYMWVDGPLRK